METEVPWVWSEASCPRAWLCVVCRCSGAVWDPAQAVYTIVLMPLGLALLLVGGGGAGGCPWWCAAWPWPVWPWVAVMGRGQWWVGCARGPRRVGAPRGDLGGAGVRAGCAGGVVVVVVVVGGQILLHVAVLGVVPVHLGLRQAFSRPLVVAGPRVLRMGQAQWVGGCLGRG